PSDLKHLALPEHVSEMGEIVLEAMKRHGPLEEKLEDLRYTVDDLRDGCMRRRARSSGCNIAWTRSSKRRKTMPAARKRVRRPGAKRNARSYDVARYCSAAYFPRTSLRSQSSPSSTVFPGRR